MTVLGPQALYRLATSKATSREFDNTKEVQLESLLESYIYFVDNRTQTAD